MEQEFDIAELGLSLAGGKISSNLLHKIFRGIRNTWVFNHHNYAELGQMIICKYIFCWIFNKDYFAAEEDEANVQLYEKPVPENDFVRHCVQRRKYPVLLKVRWSNWKSANLTFFHFCSLWFLANIPHNLRNATAALLTHFLNIFSFY